MSAENMATGQPVVVVNRHGRHDGTVVRVRADYVTISYGPHGRVADDFWIKSRRQIGYKGDTAPVFEVSEKPACPDDGTCHHSCPSAAACFRVACCGPLSGVYPGNQWPEGMSAAAREARADCLTVEDLIVGAAVLKEDDR